MKHIKFIKDHTSGQFQKGEIVSVTEQGFEAWTNSEFAEASTKKEFDSYIVDKRKRIDSETKEARKKHFDKMDALKKDDVKVVHPSGNKEEETDFEQVDLGNVSTTNGTNGGNNSESGSEVLKYTLTQQDLIDETELTEGFEVGDEIEVNEEAAWMVDEDDKLIKLN